MNIVYVRKGNIPLKIKNKIKYFLGKVTVKQFEQGSIFEVPININNGEKQVNRTIENVLKQIKKLNIDTIVFSEKILSENKLFIEQLQQKLSQNSDILDGKKLMRYMNFNIFEYILDLQKKEMGQEDIFFLIKKEPNLDLQFLSRFVENCKTVNIVTNDMERFKRIQESLYERENILISVSNNKAKSLKRAKYIFNINMDKKDIEKYKINRDAIIVNFGENIKYDCNTFDGINVNYFQIDMPDEYIERFEPINGIEEFDEAKLYESVLIRKIEIEKKKSTILSKSELAKRKNIVNDIIKQDEIKIMGLIGNNGIIDESEIIKKCQSVKPT